MQLHVDAPGSRTTFASARGRGAMTAVTRFTSPTFKAPVSDPGTRPFPGTWRAVSVGPDKQPDGWWEYHRQEQELLRWTVVYLPTGQSCDFRSLDDAREATAGPLLTELRGAAFVAAFDQPTAEGQRWIAIHLRINGGSEVDALCLCGGLLVVAFKDGRYAHVDACSACRDTLPVTSPTSCAVATDHLFCARPDPLLTELEARMLEFERQWWTRAGAKVAAIREQFGVSDVRFYATLNRLIDKPDAVRRYPMVVRRLKEIRSRRRPASA